jgi:ATP-dependent DNA ligase
MSIAALRLGRREGKQLVYVGKAGPGFTAKSAMEVRKRLEPLMRKTPPKRPQCIAILAAAIPASSAKYSSTHRASRHLLISVPQLAASSFSRSLDEQRRTPECEDVHIAIKPDKDCAPPSRGRD